MIFGKNIKEFREEHGMVQRKLAAALDREVCQNSWSFRFAV